MHLSPEVVDIVADYLAIFVLCFVPALLIYLFWMVHILPEKIAERRGHPQADAIKTLCLLSLVFGGLLWPIAWLWAYSKPVFYKMAYGADRVEHGPGDQHAVMTPTPADLAVIGGGHHGAVALGETKLSTLGTLPLER
jgi:CBS domain containing-hemolysin-like protein